MRAGQVQHPRVVTVVLSWNGCDDTLACLESLERSSWPNSSAIVVDNGSTDGTVDAVRERFPDVDVIPTGANLGFAEGNNVGMRAALATGADYILLLNNDTVAHEHLITELVHEGELRPDAGALCPIIYYLDRPDRIWYAGARFDARRGHNGRHTGYGERDVGQYHSVREVGRGTGAAMLMRREAVESVGLLDAELFLQVEDVEWSLRVRRAGWRIFFVPQARVWHRVSVSSGGEHSPSVAYYETRNTLTVADRYAPLRGVSGARRRAAILAVGLVHARRSRRPAANVRAVLEGWRDFHDGRLGPRSEPSAVATPEPARAPVAGREPQAV